LRFADCWLARLETRSDRSALPQWRTLASRRAARGWMQAFRQPRDLCCARSTSKGVLVRCIRGQKPRRPRPGGVRQVWRPREVCLWGTVVEHEIGWRAEYAYPKSLVLPLSLLPHDMCKRETLLTML